MTTSWYYDSLEKGGFPHQQQLCERVEWAAGCNLEGRKLVSSDCLSATYGNPLTIRLIALDEALKHFDNAKKIGKEIKELEEKQLRENGHSGMGITWQDKNSLSNTKGAPIETFKIAGKDFDFRHDYIQLALYEFFTNFGSVIDRLAFEIDKLHELNIPRYSLDWGKLTSKPELRKLSVKNQVLAKLLGKYRNNFWAAIRYRNRLIHDGIIDFEVEREHKCRHTGLRIKLRKKPDNDDSPFSVDAIEFCEERKVSLLRLLDRSYELILQHIENHGNPPW